MASLPTGIEECRNPVVLVKTSILGFPFRFPPHDVIIRDTATNASNNEFILMGHKIKEFSAGLERLKRNFHIFSIALRPVSYTVQADNDYPQGSISFRRCGTPAGCKN